MSNPFSGIITSDLKTLYTNMIDALLEDTALTVPCKLIYEGTKWTLCPNCRISPISGRSTNVYNGTGPVSFSMGTCPVCNGDGRLQHQTNETIYMAVLWNYRDWIVEIPVNYPEGHIQTISKINTVDQIKRANEMVVDTNIEQYSKHIFEREGEPNPLGFGADSYVFTMWKRK